MTPRMPRRIQAALTTLLLLLVGSAAIAQNAAPTDQDLQQMFDKKEYRYCLQQTARVLRMQGLATTAYNRCTLQMRRGECFLNLGDYPSALLAFQAAMSASPTPAQAEQCRAIVALVKASRNGQYAPPPPASPIGIISPDTRKLAMQALLAERLAGAAAEIKAAQNATSLVPIIRFVPRAQELHAIEIAGFDNDPQTRPMLQSIGELARTMISAELANVDARITGIEHRANQMASSGFNWVTAANGSELLVADTRIGLTSTDRETLRQLMPYLQDITTACNRGRQVAQSLGADGKAWEPLIAQSKSVSERAQNVLDAE